jgi:hypothetical protein
LVSSELVIVRGDENGDPYGVDHVLHAIAGPSRPELPCSAAIAVSDAVDHRAAVAIT